NNDISFSNMWFRRALTMKVLEFKTFVPVFVFLFSLPLSQVHATPILDRAQAIFQEAEEGNQSDLNLLWNRFEPICQKLSGAEFNQSKEGWIDILKKDIQAFELFLNKLGK